MRPITAQSNQALCRYLVDNGANIDVKNKDGDTPLHYAAKGSYLYLTPEVSLELVKLLIEKGAQIDVTNNNNETPFYQANKGNRTDIARYLLEKKREMENQNQQENLSTKDPCIICMEPRNGIFILIPCGHISLCELCSYNLTQEAFPKCPTCRKPVQFYTKGFIQA